MSADIKTDAVALLGQDEIWVDRQGQAHRIVEMTRQHRENSAALLLRWAPRAVFGYALRHPVPPFGDCGEMTYSILSSEEARSFDDPERWMRDRPQYRALLHDLPPEPTYGPDPWAGVSA